MFTYFDIHSHLNLDPLKEEAEGVIKTLEKESVGTITVGTNLETSQLAVELAEKSNNLFAGVGLHPTEAGKGFEVGEYKKLARHRRVVCIGECGLDYYRLKIKDLRLKELQREVFKKHIELALELDLPLMLHIRPSAGTQDAYNDLYEIITSNNLQLTIDTSTPPLSSPSFGGGGARRAEGEDARYWIPNTKYLGNVHFFGGNRDIAEKLLGLGFTISFAGPITFTRDYDEVVRYAPLDMIHAETDAPFAAPEPHRGKTNYPYYVKEVVKKIAEIRDEDFEKVREQLIENANRAFNIDT